MTVLGSDNFNWADNPTDLGANWTNQFGAD